MRDERKRFEAAGRPVLVYDDIGDPAAPPVILLAGSGGDRANWTDVAPRLAGAYRVMVLDHRGHGDSDPAPGEYLLEHFAGDLEVFIEKVVGDAAALVGHSLGGFVSAHVAATRPDLLRSAFLEDPPLLMDTETMVAAPVFGPLQQFLRELRDRGGTVEELVAALTELQKGMGFSGEKLREQEAIARRLAPGLHACDPDIFTPVVDGSQFAAYDPKRPMQCPVHLLRADPAVGPPPIGGCFLPEHEESFLEIHPRASVELVEGAGHGIHFERPDWFTDRLEAFLDKEAT